ncbi:outer membrane protein assembly factor BamD [Blattabacterium cuenoti]|uniref:outer membrane protein assembly factor BamD n=1 Tax=Blattabacterium cuenoti TaxID=1653831 RepID=UPI00163B7009|nr:outer membrane protein assembly factor BamD [Blattabacterium cuenoti]
MVRLLFIITVLFTSFLFEGCFILPEKQSVFSEEEALFYKGKRHSLSSLNFDLDQTKTDIAINNLNQFIEKYPDSSKIKEAYRLLNNLLEKIEKKNYYIANSYFLMRRFQASLIYFQDLITDFPESRFKEKIMYKICVSQYQLSRKKDFVKSYNEYMKNFSYSSNAKKLKVLYKKL